MHIKQINKTSEQDNKALRSALTAALSPVSYTHLTLPTIYSV